MSNKVPIYKVPYDIIEYICTYLDNEDYFSCLLSSKIFNLKDLNNSTVHRYLYRKYKDKSIDDLSKIGDLKGVQFLTSIGRYTCTCGDVQRAIDRAAERGHLEIVKFLYENRKDIKGVAFTKYVMDVANFYGHSDIVEYLKSIQN